MTQTTEQTIQALIDAHPVVLFMKGTPVFPMCGFSSKVVQALRATGVDFEAVNVLEDEAIRQGIKTFTNWPTIPQLYIKGEFVGGCDIVSQLYHSGELQTMVEDL